MRHLFETEYIDLAKTDSNQNENKANRHKKQKTRSLLDDDFDEEDDCDEVESYISEKPAKRDTKVLEWWKVIIIKTEFIINGSFI